MSGVDNERPTGPMFRNGEEAKKSLELLVAQLETFRRTLGGSALSAAVGEELLPLAESLNDGAADIIDVVVGLEEKESFGDEESYWNVFRYFCVDGNVGAVRTVAQLWEHLALTFDMNGETLDTLAETLEEWAGDIEADALRKFKLTGKFIAVGDGYVFYENPLEAAKRKAAVPRVSRPKAATPVVPSIPVVPVADAGEQEATAEDSALGERVLGILQDFGGSVKQAVVVKAIVDSDPRSSHSDVLAQIDTMVSEGTLYKFKPVKGGPAYLALSMEDVVSRDNSREESEEVAAQDVDIDIVLAGEVLAILTEPGRNPLQKIATSQMINTLRGNRELDIRGLNALVRKLAERGLVTTDMGSPLAGRRKGLSRAKTRSVFRVGLPDKETKDAIRQLIESGELEHFLQ